MIFIVVKNVKAIDNPFNGYVDGHCGGDYLGIFVLSPGSLHMHNNPPDTFGNTFWVHMENRFNESHEDFYDPAK